MNDETDIRILLVDDHPLVRDGLRARLEAAPRLRVVGEVGSGQEAIEQAGACRPDLVLMDVNMKGGSGIDATARLLEHFPGIAVLILSMHDKPEYVTQAMAAGARGYVLKDAPGKDIVLAIDTVIGGGIYYSAALARQLSSPVAPDKLLTTREQEVLKHIAAGQSNKQIARALELSVRTVETHRLNIKRKLGIEGQAELIRYAVQRAESNGYS
ncbi:response regulator transcription factor [Massilia sp. 9I]|uniref:response regulator n=1 Tax=Massilia sp. 9I TaxID=2653152 RepID=UPI0012F1EAB4|nr:response regulator transcription factor [Massilia sp. 9I]VXB04776.1 Transcriptional regulatory protein MctR [Massilia sp. 9I]